MKRHPLERIVRPRLLDLFCCAGGAGMGYARAGFEITGVDVVMHANNPHPVVVADALTLDPRWIAANFDAVHASPPCQGYTAMRHAPGAKGAPRLIAATRELLQATGLPWVIENVEAAADEMRNPVMLCGTMFGLGSQGHDLQRHRLFETSFQVAPLACQHTERPVIGVYGGHARNRSSKHGGRGTRDVWAGGHRAAASEALGIDWMNLAEMSEAIPPAYTEYLGWQLRAAMMLRLAANTYSGATSAVRIAARKPMPTHNLGIEMIQSPSHGNGKHLVAFTQRAVDADEQPFGQGRSGVFVAVRHEAQCLLPDNRFRVFHGVSPLGGCLPGRTASIARGEFPTTQRLSRANGKPVRA